MSEMLLSKQNQESEVEEIWLPIFSPPHDNFKNNLQNEESIIYESIWSHISSPPRDHFNNDLKNEESIISESTIDNVCVCPKIEEKGKSPMTEFYELKSINKTSFSNLIQGVKEECPKLIMLKSIYHYFFNNGGQALKTKIIMLERRFLTIFKIAGYDPNLINPIHREIFHLSMGLWG
ncbi:hypothetical protein H5410_036574 [Solanum commersonii]|uniref:Uncharacterized protein n=1 Tax=Solanum commersonii TaxID=4109 RepID=A0A9J5Y8L2_SOLCO|nr:hypothetical protein H5410_036574 [Solanum commersonii]